MPDINKPTPTRIDGDNYQWITEMSEKTGIPIVALTNILIKNARKQYEKDGKLEVLHGNR